MLFNERSAELFKAGGHMADKEGVDEQNTKKWNDLSQDLISNLYETYSGHGKYFGSISRAMSDILFNWLFILNSGGLIGVVTIFASANKSALIDLSPRMAFWFALGLFLIYIAAQFEKRRFDKKGKALDDAFDLLKIGSITVGEYSRRISSDTFPWGWLITTIEIFSFISFLLGVLIGFSFNNTWLKIILDNICLHGNICLLGYS